MVPNSAASVSSFRQSRLYGDEGALQELAASQPVAVAVEVSDPDFRHYRSGVYAGSAACGQQLNHAVTVVGYGATDVGEEYWVVKNSWEAWWGERGYMRIARGNGANSGIATYANYPTMECSWAAVGILAEGVVVSASYQHGEGNREGAAL